MGARSSDRKGWLHYAALGCAGVLLVAAATVTTAFLVARGQVGRAKMVTRTLTRDLPQGQARGVGGDRPSARAGHAGAIQSDGPRLSLPGALPGGPGRITLDLAHAEFLVQAAAPKEPLRVDAQFDADVYELVDALDDSDAARWSYEVRFRQKRHLGVFQILRQALGGRAPRVSVFLPREVPVDLGLKVAQGGSRVDLGGLWLTNAELTFTQGGGELDFSTPLSHGVDTLAINSSMGGGAFKNLGNASPERLKVEGQMGGTQVDLRGHWVRDCQISLANRMGGMEVRLPKGVRIRGLDRGGETEADGDKPGDAPVLTFSVSSEMGEVHFAD